MTNNKRLICCKCDKSYNTEVGMERHLEQSHKIRIKIYKWQGQNVCPFCRNMGDIFVESNNCGGYRSHLYCLEEVRAWQDKHKKLVLVI